MYDQKEIVLVPFPYSDLSKIKKRPALIISNEKINKSQDRVCLLVTRQFHKEDVPIGGNLEEGDLQFKSFVKAHRIFSVHEKVIIKKLCKVKDGLYDEVILKLNDYLKRN
tara:strand:+ start:636 stop:965 length:330 start_codon:yes stop_codon:yes gene_type:complete